MSVISLRLDDREERLIRDYARMHQMSVSELLRTAVLEKIEDQIDLTTFDDALAAMKRTYTSREIKDELGL